MFPWNEIPNTCSAEADDEDDEAEEDEMSGMDEKYRWDFLVCSALSIIFRSVLQSWTISRFFSMIWFIFWKKINVLETEKYMSWNASANFLGAGDFLTSPIFPHAIESMILSSLLISSSLISSFIMKIKKKRKRKWKRNKKT
jgi:hypothetical protein